MAKGYVYKTTNLLNGKWYIGSKRGEYNPLYLGSGTALKRAINKYGRVSFTTVMLCEVDDAYEMEELILQTLDAKEDNWSYNLSNQPQGSYECYDITKTRISEKNKGKKFRLGHKNTKNHNQKISQSHANNPKKFKQVLCVETGIIYKSLQEAELSNNIKPCSISSAISRNSKCGGLTWQHVRK